MTPYRASAKYLHDYYSVKLPLMKTIYRDTFLQLDPDEETERFLQFSTDLCGSSWRYKYLLNYIMHKRRCTSPCQSGKQLLRTAGFNLAAHDLRILDIGQGSGTILKSVGKATQTGKLFAFDKDLHANDAAEKRGIKILSEEDFRLHTSLDHAHREEEDKFDLVILSNVLDRTIRPASVLEDALWRTKRSGFLLVSVSVPWRPFYGSKHVRGGYSMYKDRTTNKQLKEKLVEQAPSCEDRKYPWWSPPKIPASFEEAAQDILKGVTGGGERLQYVNRMWKLLDYADRVGVSSVSKLELKAWTRSPYCSGCAITERIYSKRVNLAERNTK
ncbi:Oidioi.mRNA.OKI2018_I69.XSR.g15674.t1.cds [Oikopleura dioica]|uniref:Oidioi.mRNA.OKI2018_I69.XSR.g15674.t1.cds n=1 Tax=Oikopleura dioica TaxID=34765 RepID=A0ABN7SIP7_OIKDI|nr:Oidioi.mRNA.OKI2018_I69.XSR.g15674.t1.cds [Oikopleura dioica]